MKKAIYILFFAIILIACGKTYDDGPSITFRSAKNRIVGTWKVDKFYIDGADSTDEFNSKLGCQIEFLKDPFPQSYKCFKLYLKQCNDNAIYSGYWCFLSSTNKNKVQIDLLKDTTFINAIGTFGSERYGRWTILKLTNKELNLTTEGWDYEWGFGMRTFLLNLKKI
ncbi:MAG: hypothetical protein HGB12_02330 [Bacteroidetes bacterium]|nr:hypothetical protein [Bacteroidota bacterium]